jgi:hypothetical protein
MAAMSLSSRASALIDMSTRRRVAMTRVRLRRPTASLRMLPDFLIIGAQRCGTSSLYRWLGGHPEVAASLRKEIDYFARYNDRGMGWYRSHFPLRVRNRQTFEATPDYLLHPLAATRAKAVVPNAKLVALLRDPAERAYSQYQHMIRRGYETLEFDAALDAEHDRISGEFAEIAADPDYDCVNLRRFSYVHRGQYAQHLERWFAEYPADRMLVLRSEDLYERPDKTFAQLLEFLDLAPWQPDEFERISYRGPERGALPGTTRERLIEEFKAPNEQLFALLDRDFAWH